MRQLDPFLVTFQIERLMSLNKDLKQKYEDYKKQTTEDKEALTNRIDELENTKTELNSSIETLLGMVDGLGDVIESMNGELIDAKLTNIKQEMVTRTLLNLAQYKAHDMFVDTFTTADDIDWAESERGTWFGDLKGIGRTTESTVYAEQTIASSKLLITANSGDDNALCQSFTLDKTQDIDKISLYLEKHHENTWRPLEIKVTADLQGTQVITRGTIQPTEITMEGWYDIEVNNIQLQKFKEYFITISTTDTYGYRIGQDATGDRYFVGTSYIQFNGVWTDNNYDAAFKVWCYAAEDEDNATIITTAHEYTGKLQTIVFEAESVTYSGSINYYVSCDDGENWKILEPGMETSLEDIPSTNKVRIKTYINGNSRVDAWGYVIKRSDKE